jgi:hypothetical protein
MAMSEADLEIDQDTDPTDRSAILMMFAYVEAECRRLGAEDAARHAALAATLFEVTTSAADCLAGGDNLPLLPLH